MALISLSEWVDRYGDGAELVPGAVPRRMTFHVEPARQDGGGIFAWQRMRPPGITPLQQFARRPFVRWMLGFAPRRSSTPAQRQGRSGR
jgi:hypothetical protein